MFYMWYCSKLNSKTNLLEPHCKLPVLSTSKLSNQVQNDQKIYVGEGGAGGRLVLVSTRPATESEHFKVPLHCHLHFSPQRHPASSASSWFPL